MASSTDRGTSTFSDGDKYVGEHKDGKSNGQGTYTFFNGSKYFGEFKDDKLNGQGSYTFANGDKYVGEYKDGKRDGRGTQTFANGDKYFGEFKDDKPSGQGTYTLPNGDKYVGERNDGNAMAQRAMAQRKEPVRPTPAVQPHQPTNETPDQRLMRTGESNYTPEQLRQGQQGQQPAEPGAYDPALEARSRRIFPWMSQESQRQMWMADHESEQLDRQRGNSYSLRIR